MNELGSTLIRCYVTSGKLYSLGVVRVGVPIDRCIYIYSFIELYITDLLFSELFAIMYRIGIVGSQ